MEKARREDVEEQVVVFRLGDEAYGLNIAKVREIIVPQRITRVPKAPAFVEGVINLRGNVIPVIDLHRRFDLNGNGETSTARIMVVEIAGQIIGMVVDAVTEVLRVSKDQIEPPAPLISSVDAQYLRGVAKLDDRLVILLDADRILDHRERESLASEDMSFAEESVVQ